jgi:pimeloyl-ACP methyl ester carboxylesterase
MVLLHGFTDTWRTWDLVRPHLEPHFDILAPTLVGHAGAPMPNRLDVTSDQLFADGVERAMDEAGFETAHIVGNSLGGYVAMHLAERGRAKTVTALAPAGGWADGDPEFDRTRKIFRKMQRQLIVAAPLAPAIMATRAGRRYATRDITEQYRHIPPSMLVEMVRGARACPIAKPLLELADDVGWGIDASKITCPVQIVWGLKDRILRWPVAAANYKERWAPNAHWVEVPTLGHCPQLDDPAETARLVTEFIAANAPVGQSQQ